MITAAIIRKGARYLNEHLVKSDYRAEGEKQVEGEWIGIGAERLGLEGWLDEEGFDQIRSNRNPLTGESLTMREDKDWVALVDLQLYASKDVRVLGMVGGDERVVEAFHASVETPTRVMRFSTCPSTPQITQRWSNLRSSFRVFCGRSASRQVMRSQFRK